MELINSLESNDPHVVEQTKKNFHEYFNASKDPALLSGLFDYFVQTNSIRSVEIIVSAREPHDKHLYDRIEEGLKQPYKLQALTLLGHVVRRQPPWIYKITQHSLLRNLLKLLKTETEILPLMSALLILIILLPMIPANIAPYLDDIFDIFSRLAAWNRNNPGKLAEEHLLHLQVGMYALFLRLYGMYPCSFLSHLRHVYGHGSRDVFSHTIKPMLDTVKMHPLLITANKDAETSTSRWKKMGHHDVIVECAKLSLDPAEKLREDTLAGLTTSYRCRSGPDYLNTLEASASQIEPTSEQSYLNLVNVETDLFSPTYFFEHSASSPVSDIGVPTSVPQTPIIPSSTPQAIISSSIYTHQEGTSPPEAAVEATPETTPIKDIRMLTSGKYGPPQNSSVVRALTNFNTTKWGDFSSNFSQSQPSSPMKKDMSSQFKFPTDTTHSAFEQPRKESSTVSSVDFNRHDNFITQRVSRLIHDRSVVNETMSERLGFTGHSKTPVLHPTSPLRVITCESSVPNSPVPIETTAPTPGANKDWHVAKPKPEKNGFRFESPVTQDISQEDQEVTEIVRQGEQFRHSSETANHHTDSAPSDFHLPHHHEDYEECEQHLGFPCTRGGLHMPNSQSMIHFARGFRFRFYSQCTTDYKLIENEFSSGSSPGDRVTSLDNIKVRRAKSLPNMKRTYSVLPSTLTNNKILSESDELETTMLGNANDEQQSIINAIVNGEQEFIDKKQFNTIGVQTIDTWPQSYVHLFSDLFPSVETTTIDTQTSAGPSPAPLSSHNIVRISPYEMLDRYIETSKQIASDKDGGGKRIKNYEQEIKSLKEQLELVHLQVQFERHRRDVHSERNRRLMGKAKSNKSLEECNYALRDQLALLQKEMEQLRSKLENERKEAKLKDNKLQDNGNYWQTQCMTLQDQNKLLKSQKDSLEETIKMQNSKIKELSEKNQETEASLLDLCLEMQCAQEQAKAGAQIRADFEQLQREHLLLGELHLKYQERFSELQNLRCRDEEIEMMHKTNLHEIEALNQQLLNRNSIIESLKVRNNDLENEINKHEEMCSEQKRTLQIVKDEYQEKLNAVESKYKTQHIIIKRMEENILELLTRIDRLEYGSRRAVRSPESLSSGRDIGSGEKPSVSPHSSPPLSVSLTSSEGGSMAFLQTGANASLPTDVEIKNLQIIVDQPEQKMNDGEPSTSYRTEHTSDHTNTD